MKRGQAIAEILHAKSCDSGLIIHNKLSGKTYRLATVHALETNDSQTDDSQTYRTKDSTLTVGQWSTCQMATSSWSSSTSTSISTLKLHVSGTETAGQADDTSSLLQERQIWVDVRRAAKQR